MANCAQSESCIGFAKLPEQLHRKTVKKGFEFTFMVVGESGLGKSTLINSLFLTNLYKERQMVSVNERITKTTRIDQKSFEIEEKGIRVRLNIIDTPGFGDSINCEDSFRACTEYIDEKFRQFFNDENSINRKNIQDGRVHCCLYFVPSYCHSLRSMDIEMMKRLHEKVNLIVIISKADSLTAKERIAMKARITKDIEAHAIQLYQFPECDSDEDEDFQKQDRELKNSLPFAVVASNTVLDIQGKLVRARQYPWGIVDVEDPNHSDFIKLRTMLISTHMQDLKDVTEEVHYENFRANYISRNKKLSLKKLLSENKSDSEVSNFISETDMLLQVKDDEIKRMQEVLTQMKEQLKGNTDLENRKHDSVIEV